MEKILIVEDNETILKGLQYSLEQEGFFVSCATCKKEAQEKIQMEKQDLVLLDVSLPDGDGFEVCTYLKSISDIPVIFLTARDEETNIVYGLDMGADDYITKPFRIRELISRIRTVLRRYRKEEKGTGVLTYQEISIDTTKAIIKKKGEEIIFTALEYKILLMLFSNLGQIITREQVLEKIWDIAGNFVNDNTLTVYIKRIREKIEEDPTDPKIIKTIRGIGYRVGD